MHRYFHRSVHSTCSHLSAAFQEAFPNEYVLVSVVISNVPSPPIRICLPFCTLSWVAPKANHLRQSTPGCLDGRLSGFSQRLYFHDQLDPFFLRSHIVLLQMALSGSILEPIFFFPRRFSKTTPGLKPSPFHQTTQPLRAEVPLII